MIFLDDCIDFVTQAKVERQIGGHAKIVLNKAGISPVVNVPGGIANQQSGVARHAREKVFNALRERVDRGAGPKFESAPASAIGAAREGVTMQLSAKLDGVLAHRVGNVIDELDAGVRSLYLGPVKPAQFLRENVLGKNTDARQPAIEGLVTPVFRPYAVWMFVLWSLVKVGW